MKSVLVGNGFNIQFGNNLEKAGNAYNNRFILQRIIFNAKAEKYAPLFDNKVNGDDIATIFSSLVHYANKIRSGIFDNINNEDDLNLKNAIVDFKDRYKDWEPKHTYDIGLEDWFLLIKLFFIDNPDISNVWLSAKQGFERIVLDAIYNNGCLQNLYHNINKPVKRFFSDFDNIFTLNYDNNLENLTKRDVYHLHGDFSVMADSENPDTVLGYIRQRKGEFVHFPIEFKHCYCNALLDYSGNLKLKRANDIEKCQETLESLKALHETSHEEFNNEFINTYIQNPNLRAGTDYHFKKFYELSGELVIIGMSPNNDSHIFRCIDNSNIERITFYHFYNSKDKTKPTLPLSKPYKILDVNDLWKQLKCTKKIYNCNEVKFKYPDIDKFIKVFNALSGDEITKKQVIDEFNAIPQFEAERLYKLVKEEIKNEKYHISAKTKKEFMQQWHEITRIGLCEGVFPSVLYFIYINSLSTENDKKT